ncbi:MAG: hypothetical protein ACRC9R_10675, partial [Enterovibrio sp.]
MHRETKQFTKFILARQDQNQYDPKAKRAVLKMNRELAAIPNSDGSAKKYRFKALLFTQGQVSADGSSLAQSNLGFCDLMASSVAYEMKMAKTESTSTRTADGTNVHTVKQIFERVTDLDDYLSDPVTAYRFMQGATRINDHLQRARAHLVAPHAHKLNTLDELSRYISRVTKDDPIVISFGRNSKAGEGHAVSISPVIANDANGRKLTTYLVTDANNGIVPCATLDQAIDILKMMGASFLSEDINNPNLTDLKIWALPVNDAVAAIMKDPVQMGAKEVTIARADGTTENYRYGDMFGESSDHWSHWAKSNDASDSPSWHKLLPKELAQKSIELGDYNLQADLKEKYGPNPDDILIPKTNQLLDEMLAVSANKQAGCVIGTCTIDFQKYYEGNEYPLRPSVPPRESKTNTALLGQQLGNNAATTQATGPGEPIYGNIQTSSANDDPVYGNVKRHQAFTRKKVIKKKSAQPKLTYDEIYANAKPVLGLDLPDAVYGNIFSAAKKQGISLANADAATFKAVANAAGQSVSDEDIWGP